MEALPVRFGLSLVYGVEAAAFIALAILAKTFFLPAVLALALLDGVLWLSSITIIQGTTAHLLGRGEELRRGNALLNIAFTVAFAVGPAIGGVAVAFLGLQVALLIDAGTFTVAALVLLNTKGLPAGHPAASEWFEHLKDGLRFLRGQIALKRLIAANTAMVLFAAAVIPIEVVFVKEALHSGDAAYGLFLAFWGVGAALGGLIFLVYSQAQLYLLALLGTAAMAMTYLGTALAPTLPVACAMQLIGGLGNGVVYVSVITIIQLLTPDAFQNRVVAVHNALASSLTRGVAYIVGGALAATISTRFVFGFAGIGVLLTLLVAVPLLITYSRLPSVAARPRAAEYE